MVRQTGDNRKMLPGERAFPATLCRGSPKQRNPTCGMNAVSTHYRSIADVRITEESQHAFARLLVRHALAGAFRSGDRIKVVYEIAPWTRRLIDDLHRLLGFDLLLAQLERVHPRKLIELGRDAVPHAAFRSVGFDPPELARRQVR